MNNSKNLAEYALSGIQKAFKLPLRYCGQYKRVVLMGAGDIGRIVYCLGKDQGIEFCGVIDDFCTEASFMGLPIFPLADAVEKLQPDAILLATITSAKRMSESLERLNCKLPIIQISDIYNFHNVHTPRTSDDAEIAKYFNLHQGRRAFIVCNGPSLLKTDPRRLKNEIVFACNNIYLLENFAPSYYVAEDRVLTWDRAKEINALPWIKFFPDTISGWLDNGIFLKSISNEWPETFSCDLTKGLEINFTVTYSMMQVAYYMGCNPVYLIGCDHSYVVDEKQCSITGEVITSIKEDPNHFHPQYFGPGYRWHNPRVDRMEAAYRLAKKLMKEPAGQYITQLTEANSKYSQEHPSRLSFPVKKLI